MTWIKGTERQTLQLKTTLERAYTHLVSPSERAKVFQDIERREVVDESTERWILTTRREMGIVFQPDYTAKYTGNGKDSVTWDTLGKGNTRTSGFAKLKALGPNLTEIIYEETVESDLPIPSLAATVFRPLVAREIRRGVKDFLEGTQKKLES